MNILILSVRMPYDEVDIQRGSILHGLTTFPSDYQTSRSQGSSRVGRGASRTEQEGFLRLNAHTQSDVMNISSFSQAQLASKSRICQLELRPIRPRGLDMTHSSKGCSGLYCTDSERA